MSLAAVCILAWGVLEGIHPVGATLLALTLFDPRWGAVACLGVIALARHRNRADTITVSRRFFERVSAELGAGMSLRAALVEGVSTLPAIEAIPLRRRLEAGSDLIEIGPSLARAVPLAGPSLAAAIGVASTGGGPSGAVFTGLGLDVAEEAELSRERRVLTTQARVTSMIVGGVPFGFLLFQLATGSLQQRFATSHGVLLTLIGASLVLVGVVWVYLQLRRTHV